jgi:hypothetical protein
MAQNSHETGGASRVVGKVRRNRQSLLESAPRFTSHTRGYVGLKLGG